MVGYGANKVFILLFRVSSPFPVKKSSIVSKPTMTPTKNTKLVCLCFKFITKRCKIYSSLLPKDPSKDTKSGSTRPLVSTSKVFQNIVSILTLLLNKKCKKVAETDPSQPLKWTPHPVVPIPSYQSSSSKENLCKEKREKSCLLSTWSI
jgi:hypothetical protein